jgi:outer membrane lipoprotein SlyB
VPLGLMLSLAGCANPPMAQGGSHHASVASAPVLVWGRIQRIEYVPPGTPASAQPNVLGAVVGGVAGAALGSTIGEGAGRGAATVLGGVAGAAVGSRVARNSAGTTTDPSYRVAVQSDQGMQYTYEVPAVGDLKVGDRVRVENNVIQRQ